MQVLHFSRLFDARVEPYTTSYYFLTHVIVLLYLILFLVGMLILERRPLSNAIITNALQVNDKWLILVFGGWLTVKGYLVLKYGVSAFWTLRNLAGRYAIIHYSAWWETPLETYIRAFAMGASVIFLIKAAYIKGYWKRGGMTALFVIFLSVFVFVHETTLGPRRFLFLLGLVAVLAYTWRERTSIPNYIIKHWRQFLTLVILVVCLSSYYQVIRTNFYTPRIYTRLWSSNPLEFTQGLYLALIPLPPDQRAPLDAPFIRAGPFEIIYQVFETRVSGNPGTEGEITKTSLQMIVPRVIAGSSKTDINADDIFEQRMGIIPQGRYTKPDIATSLLAIFTADYGIIGAVIPPLIVLLSLFLFSYLASRPNKLSPLMMLYTIYALLYTAGNVEGDLVAVLATYRDLLILALIIAPLTYLARVFLPQLRGRAQVKTIQ
jgi:hypothetical protein